MQQGKPGFLHHLRHALSEVARTYISVNSWRCFALRYWKGNKVYLKRLHFTSRHGRKMLKGWNRIKTFRAKLGHQQSWSIATQKPI